MNFRPVIGQISPVSLSSNEDPAAVLSKGFGFTTILGAQRYQSSPTGDSGLDFPAFMEHLDQAVELLRQGRLVAFPTETVYGLGARADVPEAAAGIFHAKNRPSFDPLIVHVPDLEAATEWAVFDDRARRLADRFWPGPLTMVLPRRRLDGVARIPDLVTSGLDSVGIRVPAQPLALELLRRVGLPIAAPSANRFGYVSPTTAEHVRTGLGNRVDLVLDGGPCQVGVESTIVDLCSERPRLLRPGGLARELLETHMGCALEYAGFAPPVRTEAPGMMESHYSPGVPVEVFEDLAALRTRSVELGGHCVLLSESVQTGLECLESIALGTGPAMAVNLFATLRRLDDPKFGRILALLPSPEGLGLAVRDRLFRAAKSRIG